ncbi:MAG TPA: STAS domain-containing protein, partial [Gemmatimonadaceae bacterium]|nr:STAS domain-containing protein [Gemmatimonadaceae bacterium]
MTDPYLAAHGRGTTTSTALVRVLEQHQDDVLADWLAAQANVGRGGAIGAGELRRQGAEFLTLLRGALASGASSAEAPAFAPVRSFLDGMSRGRAQQGYSPSETATFVFALKGPVFQRLGTDIRDVDSLNTEVWAATQLLDALGLYTTEVFQRGREEVIQRQQQDMLELSTPVVTLWEGVLALPMIGTLDSARTQVVMETLLQRIVDTGADVAILDITGVPTVDTLTAQHLLKTVTAARLMGAECIISGIRPQIAQTIVHLGVDLGN